MTRTLKSTLLSAQLDRDPARVPVEDCWHRLRGRNGIAARAIPAEYGWEGREDCASWVVVRLMEIAATDTDGVTTDPSPEMAEDNYLFCRCRDWLRWTVSGVAEELESSSGTDLAELGKDQPARVVTDPAREIGLSIGAAAKVAAEAVEMLPRLHGNPLAQYALHALYADRPAAELAGYWGMTARAAEDTLSRGRKVIRDCYPDPRAALADLLMIDPPAKPAAKRKRTLRLDPRTSVTDQAARGEWQYWWAEGWNLDPDAYTRRAGPLPAPAYGPHLPPWKLVHRERQRAARGY